MLGFGPILLIKAGLYAILHEPFLKMEAILLQHTDGCGVVCISEGAQGGQIESSLHFLQKQFYCF